MQETTDNENKWTNRAVKVMLAAVSSLVIGMIAFAICQAYNDMLNNFSLLRIRPIELIQVATNITYWFG